MTFKEGFVVRENSQISKKENKIIPPQVNLPDTFYS